jgi:hypothetical protein
MKRFLMSLAIVAFSSIAALAQLNVTSKNVSQVVGIDSAQEIGGLVFVDGDTVVSKKSVALVFAESEAANISFEVSDSSRSPVPFEQIEDGTISISKAGRSWVEVVALDFDKNIYSKKMIVVNLAGGDSDIDIVPDEVPNEYGVGLPAYTYAPDEGREEVSDIYKSGADFLYGKPEAKTVSGSSEWVRDQLKGKPEVWIEWQSKVSDAIVKSQEERVGGYSRENWYQALMEISNALRVPK